MYRSWTTVSVAAGILLAAAIVSASAAQQRSGAPSQTPPRTAPGPAEPKPPAPTQSKPPAPAARGANPSAASLAEFTARVEQYVELQKKLSQAAGPLDETKSPTEIAVRERGLAAAIQAARPNARQGDIFTKDASTIFTRVIREEFAQRSKMAVEDRDEAQDELPDFTPTVNQVYPSTYPLATFPPGVLRRIPALPKQLEYRFVQRHLILRDTEANVIVDIIPNAAPVIERTTPRRPPETK